MSNNGPLNCMEPNRNQDFQLTHFGIAYSLAPNTYNVYASKVYKYRFKQTSITEACKQTVLQSAHLVQGTLQCEGSYRQLVGGVTDLLLIAPELQQPLQTPQLPPDLHHTESSIMMMVTTHQLKVAEA